MGAPPAPGRGCVQPEPTEPSVQWCLIKCHKPGAVRAHSILPAAEAGGRDKAGFPFCSALSHTCILNESCKGLGSPRQLPSLNSASLPLSAAQPRIQVYI